MPGKLEPGSGAIGLFYSNRYLLALTIAVTMVAGISALVNLPRLEDPIITNRNPLILTVFPGASADRVEALVTEPVESELDEIDEIKDIESTSRAGISVITVTLEDAVGKADTDVIFGDPGQTRSGRRKVATRSEAPGFR